MRVKYILTVTVFMTNLVLGLSQGTEVKNLIPSNFPSDYIVTDHCPSCETADSLIFYPDRTFIFKLGGIELSQKHYQFGIWRLEGKIVKIDIYKCLGIRPIGEPTNPDVRFASNPDDYYEYEDYVPYEDWVSLTKEFDSETLNHFDISVDTSKTASQIHINMQDFLLKGNYKVASCRLLIDNDLKDLSKKDLRLMRNEIFARYGYKFKSLDLQDYFHSKEWYNGHTSNVDEYLTDTEKKNIKLIRAFEQK